MSARWDAIVVGGGHNGLVAAAYLARAGQRTLLLEARDEPGGCASIGEIHPGFRGPLLAHDAGPLLPEVVAELDLAAHGLLPLDGEADLVSIAGDGRALELSSDAARTHASLSRISSRDAERFLRFRDLLARAGAVAAPLMRRPPPDVDEPRPGDVWTLTQAGRRLRKLGRRDGATLLRWASMPVGDVATEWFEHGTIQALVATRALVGHFAGPRSPGTAAALLLRAAIDPARAFGPVAWRGGVGGLVDALVAASRAAGATLRAGTPVQGINVRDGRAGGVVLASGETIEARAVLSTVDPKRTLLRLVDPALLDPDLVHRVDRIRMRGALAKVNLAVDGLPAFAVEGWSAPTPPPRFVVAPDLDYVERAFDAAKHGRWPDEPWLEVAIPTLRDPSLAPPGRHVVSVYVQFVPYERQDAAGGDGLWARVFGTLDRCLPGLTGRVLARQIIGPQDLEDRWGLSGGHIFHGEHALDQLYLSRPLLGWARHRTPIPGLYVGGAGTHPGGGITGACARNAARIVLQDLRAAAR
jgi:phytoene dehydrogenase-like protein